MKGKLTDRVLALISAASNMYPLVTQRTQGLRWSVEWGETKEKQQIKRQKRRNHRNKKRKKKKEMKKMDEG